MEDELLRKIREQLEQGISTECQVVYLLVEIRKLLDRKRTDCAQYGSLRLYCNWAVHVELSKAQAQEIVKKADQLYSKLIKAIPITEEEKNDCRRVFTLEIFKDELNRFLSENELEPLPDAEWNDFLTSFLNVIEDCPLVCRAQRANVGEIDEVVLIKEMGDASRTPNATVPPIIWALLSGGHLKFTLGANFTLSDRLIDALVALEKQGVGGFQA